MKINFSIFETMWQQLVRQADDCFRLHMREVWGAPDRIECFTCEKFFDPNFIDVGHIFNRNHYATRWHILNVVPQCIECNRFKNGSNFEKIGEETYNIIRPIALNSKFRLTKDFIMEVIQLYGKTS